MKETGSVLLLLKLIPAGFSHSLKMERKLWLARHLLDVNSLFTLLYQEHFYEFDSLSALSMGTAVYANTNV